MLSKQRVVAAIFVVASATYPVWVYFGLRTTTPTIIVIILLGLLAGRAVLAPRRMHGSFVPILVFAALGVSLLYFVDSMAAVKAYPALISFGLATMFALSLVRPPTAIERIARLTEPDLGPDGVAYTRKVTWLWLIFFVGNGTVATWTAVYGSLNQWTVYNGLISYILIGTIFVAEYVYRRFKRKRVEA